MQVSQDKKSFLSGGTDGKVIIWDLWFKPIAEIILNTDSFISINPKIWALDINDKTKQIIIGTRGGEIILYD